MEEKRSRHAQRGLAFLSECYVQTCPIVFFHRSVCLQNAVACHRKTQSTKMWLCGVLRTDKVSVTIVETDGF